MDQHSIFDYASDGSPALAIYNSALYMAWIGKDNSQKLWWSSVQPFDDWNEATWSSQQHATIGSPSANPAIAPFPLQNKLYMAWKGMNDDQGIYWSSFDGASWAPQQEVSGVGTSTGPALAFHNNRLYMAWKGEFNDPAIYWSSFDGANWASQQSVPGVGTSHTPALAAFDGQLYMAWKGMLDDVRPFWSFFDGSNWAPQQFLPGVGTSAGPALTVQNNRLYMAWKGMLDDVRPFWSKFDGTTWCPQQLADGVGTSAGPALAAFSNGIFMAWKGQGNSTQLWWGPMVPPQVVPNLVGHTLPDAQQLLQRWQLMLGQVTYDGPPADATRVIAQSPAAGFSTSVDSSVDVTLGVPTVGVPDVIGHQLSEARLIIQRAQLNVGKIFSSGPATEDMQVIDQSPVAGAAATMDSTVDLTVKLVRVSVPRLVGHTLGDASSLLQQAGLQLGQVSGPPGIDEQVINQSPGPGTQVTKGSSVDVTVVQPTVGFSWVVVYNCRANPVHVWAFDHMTDQWSELQGSPVDSGADSAGNCPGLDAKPASLSAASNHSYTIVAVDPTNCGGVNDPRNNSCVVWFIPNPVPGATDGPVMTQYVI